MTKKKKIKEAKKKKKKNEIKVRRRRRCRCIPGVPPLDYHSGTHCSTTFLSLCVFCDCCFVGTRVVVEYTRRSRSLTKKDPGEIEEKNSLIDDIKISPEK
jgi:hypothetical protein